MQWRKGGGRRSGGELMLGCPLNIYRCSFSVKLMRTVRLSLALFERLCSPIPKYRLVCVCSYVHRDIGTATQREARSIISFSFSVRLGSFCIGRSSVGRELSPQQQQHETRSSSASPPGRGIPVPVLVVAEVWQRCESGCASRGASLSVRWGLWENSHAADYGNQ